MFIREKVSNNNLHDLHQGKNGSPGVPNMPSIPTQYLNNQGQAPRLGTTQPSGNSGGQPQGGRGSAQGSTQGPPSDSIITSPIDVPTLIATKGYNPVDFDTRPLFVRFQIIPADDSSC